MKKIITFLNWFDFLKVDNSLKDDFNSRKKIKRHLSNEINEKLNKCQSSTYTK
jgi:hypothetical protein